MAAGYFSFAELVLTTHDVTLADNLSPIHARTLVHYIRR